MGVLRVLATMLHFLQAVSFSQNPVILPRFRSFFNVAKSDLLSVCLSVCAEQLSSHYNNFHGT
jgi:hypothetical protein